MAGRSRKRNGAQSIIRDTKVTASGSEVESPGTSISGSSTAMSSQNNIAEPEDLYISEERSLHKPIPLATSNSRRSTRSRQAKTSPKSPTVEAEEFLKQPATADDRQKWKGWCEIESDPVGFLMASFHH